MTNPPTYINPLIWPGSGSLPVTTSLGLYMNDPAFQAEAEPMARWIAGRLSYPILSIELIDLNFYDCIEEAVSEYSAQVNEFNMRDGMLSLQGMSTGSSVTQKLIIGNGINTLIQIGENYGSLIGVGGNITIYSGSLTTQAGQQEYDLQAIIGDTLYSGSRIEVHKVYHDRIPASIRGGYGFGEGGGLGTGDGSLLLEGEFGWAGWDGALNSYASTGTSGLQLIMPVYESLLRIQAIQFNDEIRRSQYTFEIRNNKLKLFPTPEWSGWPIWFEYLIASDRNAATVDSNGSLVSDYSNAPYTNIPYSTINDVGKRWIRKYALALVKETLGRVLSKYENIPFTNPSEPVRLDGALLRQEAASEKDELWKQLRESLEESGRAKQMEKMAKNAQNENEIMAGAPLGFYIY